MPDDIADIVLATAEAVKERGVEEMKPVIGEQLPPSEAEYNDINSDLRATPLKEGERYLTPEEANARRAKIRQETNQQ